MSARYAVIGHPVKHSQSPRIHAAYAAQFGIDLQYTTIDIAPANLQETLARLHSENFLGLNVTLPHKREVAAICESVSERAQLAGAANTLTRTASGWQGDNTDGEGLVRDLKQLGFDVRGKRVLLLGAGGAARGVLKPLLDQQPALTTISNRNPWKPEELAEQFKAHGAILPCTHIALKGDLFDLIINATSSGHSGHFMKLPGQLLADGGACYDLSYGEPFLPFAAWARTQRATRISDGLGMLTEQAAAAFQIWHGKKPETTSVLRALRPRVLDCGGADTAAPARLGTGARERAVHGDEID